MGEHDSLRNPDQHQYACATYLPYRLILQDWENSLTRYSGTIVRVVNRAAAWFFFYGNTYTYDSSYFCCRFCGSLSICAGWPHRRFGLPGDLWPGGHDPRHNQTNGALAQCASWQDEGELLVKEWGRGGPWIHLPIFKDMATSEVAQ